jgi:hypothetical protein
MRIEAERERRALRRGGGVGEHPEAGRETLDLVEQQRRAFGRAGRDLGDAADLEARVGTVDAAQGAEVLSGRTTAI